MKPFRSSVLRCLLLAAVAPVSWEAAAAPVVLSPVAVPRTDLESFSPDISLERLINQSGIEKPFVSGVTPFQTYFANPGQVWATSGDQGVHNWQSALDFDLPLEGTLDFDLGDRYRVAQVGLWNRSLRDITLKMLDDLDGPEQTGGRFTLIDRQSFPFSYAVDVLSFDAPLDGRYLRLQIHAVHPIQGTTFGYATLGEVVVSAEPVPATVPTLQISPLPDGGVELRFTGTLQSASAPDAAFEDVSGNPQQSLTLPAGSLTGSRYFRSRIP